MRTRMIGFGEMHGAATALTDGACPFSRHLDSTRLIHPVVRTFNVLVDLTASMRVLRQRA